jgi:pimeloyl-ACP methyl ester carboxylesterase
MKQVPSCSNNGCVMRARMVHQAVTRAPDTLGCMKIRRIEIAAGEYVFDALTAGPERSDTVLLLHGFPQSAEMWRPAMTSLASAGFRVVAPNQRGYTTGASPEDVASYRLPELVSDVIGIATALDARRFHVIGHDWGGTVAWSLAAQHPEQVISLTSISTPHMSALATALRGTQQRARMAYITLLQAPLIPELLVRAGNGALLQSTLTLTGLSAAHARRDVRNLLQRGITGPLNWYRAIDADALRAPGTVTVPTLHIWGDADVAFGREATELTARHVTGPYHLVELEGGSHWIPDEHWNDVEDVVLEHLQAHTARRRRR